ncbi:hypothetical protein ACRQ5D_10795 [Mucilaginibacter sp. P25]|uniref:hypothetical protein n=1 Tax=Mucilaginibacter sp. P25 TaxID=3423945 RepID=UPI003D7AB4C2
MESTQTGTSGAPTWWTYLQYNFRDKTRVCHMAVVTCEGGPYYFFSFKKYTPASLVKKDGLWYDGLVPIADRFNASLLQALAAAIDAGTYGDNYTPDPTV